MKQPKHTASQRRAIAYNAYLKRQERRRKEEVALDPILELQLEEMVFGPHYQKFKKYADSVCSLVRLAKDLGGSELAIQLLECVLSKAKQ